MIFAEASIYFVGKPTHSLLRVVFQAPGKATPAMPVRLVVSLSPFTQNFQWAQIVTYHYIVS